jgi:hypothetical protein
MAMFMMNMTHDYFTPWLDVRGHLPHCILCGFTHMDCALAHPFSFGRWLKTGTASLDG